DRQPGAAEIGAAGEPQATPVGQLAIAINPVRALHYRSNALLESDGADAQPVGRDRIRLGEHAEPQLRRVLAQALGNLVELDLLSEARLWRAMAALRAAGRLVREDARRFELISRQLVGHGLQGAGVEGARHAIGAVAAAVDQRLQMHPGQLAVLGDAGAK